ncbi:MAG: glycoside hydrolase family 88 protein [Paludibacter sp.]|jgi:unsaturated rhamnogalacturonyl hydrolase|nr:glycoside hydrolase family 88 protein [Paludibacter sp.]
MKTIRLFSSLFLLFFIIINANADVKLPAILSDNMILQQQSTVNIWGKASVGEQITVTSSWNNTNYTTITAADGNWLVKITTPKAGKIFSLTVKGNNTLTINNILVGEVWLCSGQSNMDFSVSKIAGWKTGIINEESEMQDADYPQIRLFHVKQVTSLSELDDCQGEWTVCNRENLKDFSAVAFFFGRTLYKNLKTPIGLIQSSWGGTPAEAWTKMSLIREQAVYADKLAVYDKIESNYAAELAKYDAALAEYKVQKENGNPDLKAPRKPNGNNHSKSLATLWNGMIYPIVNYGIKGAIWYQGESNADHSDDYPQVFGNLINSWRTEFKRGDFPFYFVQIAPFYQQPAEIREAQLKTWQTVPNTGMAVITDAGDSTDIHPRNKTIPGNRLAYWALAKTYNKKIAFSGPLYQSVKFDANKAILTFLYTEKGLKTDGNALTGFVIAGKDKRFYKADAQIVGKTVVVVSDKVSEPVAVRYGWGNFFRANLYNTADLPASPFRTDSWATPQTAITFADSEMKRNPQAWQLDHGTRLYFGYTQGLGCLAMLKIWKATAEQKYVDYVMNWCDTIINDKGEIHLYEIEKYNLDFINSGKVLFDAYQITGNKKYKTAIDRLITQLKNHPRTFEGGFWHKLIYQHQMWLDGIYMASPFLAQYAATFDKPEMFDDVVNQILVCAKHTYDSKTGLYYHGWDESHNQRWANKETGQSPNFWGRSMGWWFMALVDVLDYLPQDHAKRAEIIKIINGLAETLPKYQDKTGLWYQVLDMGGREGNYLEASVSSMFMYSIAKSVNKGYLDPKYRAIAEKAYEGIMQNLIVSNPDGTLTLTQCNAVSGLGGSPYRDGSYDYYIHERIRENDAKATGPFIMGCLELGK